MKRRSKKLFSVLLSLAMVVTMIPAFGAVAYAAPTVSKITINADYSNLIQGMKVSSPTIDLKTDAGVVKINWGGTGWKKYNESAGKYVNFYNNTVEPGKYIYSYSLFMDPKQGTPSTPVTVIINGKSQTVTFKASSDGYYYGDVDDPEVITPRVLPALSGSVSWVQNDNPLNGGRRYDTVLSGKVAQLPESAIHYQWEFLKSNGEIGTYGGNTGSSFWAGPDYEGETVRVRVSADGYSGYIYNAWREVGEAAPYTITVAGGKADKKTALPDETVTLTAIPDNGDFAFKSWNLASAASHGKFSDYRASTTAYSIPSYGIVDDSNIYARYTIKQSQDQPGPSWSGKGLPFVDVTTGSYYYEPVQWAFYASPQVTNGIDATHFGPTQTVTRGQCVTFLWRAMGEPQPTTKTNPFVDIKSDEYWYKPILWAVEKGITVGTDKTHFTPTQTLSTAHIATFLYRTMEVGKDGWYQKAGNWAQKEGLLNDTGLTVAPGVDCPRGAVVTFLFRELAETETATGLNELGKKDFLLYVEDFYNVTGRGRVVIGRVENGSIRVGDKVTLMSYDENTLAPVKTTFTVEGIEMFKKKLDEAQKGDNVGILLGSDTSVKTPRGAALVGAGSSLKCLPGMYVGKIELNSEFKTPLDEGDTFQLYWSGSDLTTMLVGLNGDTLQPNSTREGVGVIPVAPTTWYTGQTLSIRKGGKTWGTFTITGIQ